MSISPVSSRRPFGSDPQPYVYYPTGERSSFASYRHGWGYSPRPECRHAPAAPSTLFVSFRDRWEAEQGNYDLAEFAEMWLAHCGEPGNREQRLFTRFLTLLARVLPRPLAEADARRAALQAV